MDPKSFDEVAANFRRCAKFAARAVPARQLEEFISAVSQLDKQGDVRRLATLLCQDGSPD